MNLLLSFLFSSFDLSTFPSGALPVLLLRQVYLLYLDSFLFVDFFASLGALGSHLVAKMSQDSAKMAQDAPT